MCKSESKITKAPAFIWLLSLVVLFIQQKQIIKAQAGRAPSSITWSTEDQSNLSLSQRQKAIASGKVECSEQEILYIVPQNIQYFVDTLNKLGECGYRLEKTIQISTQNKDDQKTAKVDLIKLAGIAKQNKNEIYQYQWFVAEDAPDLGLRLNNWLKQGFYFRQNIPFREGGNQYVARKEPVTRTNRKGEKQTVFEKIYEQAPINIGNIIFLEKKGAKLKYSNTM